MSDYVVYHNTESNEHSLIDTKTKANNCKFDIYAAKKVSHLPGKIVWIIEGRKEPGNKRKSYYLCERFKVHSFENDFANGRNWAYGKNGDGERYIGEQLILLNEFQWFQEFQNRMANFSLGLTPLTKEDRSNFIGAIKKFGYGDALGNKRAQKPVKGKKAGSSAEAIDPLPPSYGQGFGDSETNIEIDMAAMRCVTEFYEHAKWVVYDRSNVQNLGYDLLCKKRNVESHVEVKGCRGNKEEFFIKASQKRCAETNPCFVLAIVTNALTSPKLSFHTGAELLQKFDLSPTEYRASPKSKESVRRRGEHHAP